MCVLVVTVSLPLSFSLCVCVSILENCFSKICQQMRRAGPPHTKNFFFCLCSSTSPLVIVIGGSSHRSVAYSVGWSVVGHSCVWQYSSSVQCPVCCVSPPGVGIWRLVAAIECVKIIVNFSDTHHTSMARLSATPCQGQRQGQHQGGWGTYYKVGTSHWRGNRLKTLVGPTLFYEVLYI